MEGSRPTASPPTAENPASSAGFTNESTHSSSDASSLTAENSKEVLYRGVCGRLAISNACSSVFENDAVRVQDECARWTNEKHNLFLNLLEASFVKHMHKSITLHSRYLEQNKVKRNLFQKLPAKMNRVSKPLPVVRDFRWHKINIERDLSNLDTAAVSHGSVIDQQICLFSHSEGSDQNFVDEDHEEKTSNKRMNTSIGDISNHDQIVPSGKFENAGPSASTLERYEQSSPEHLLGNYESFVSPRTDVKYFLKGS